MINNPHYYYTCCKILDKFIISRGVLCSPLECKGTGCSFPDCAMEAYEFKNFPSLIKKITELRLQGFQVLITVEAEKEIKENSEKNKVYFFVNKESNFYVREKQVVEFLYCNFENKFIDFKFLSSCPIELKKDELFSAIDDESNMISGASQLYSFPMCDLIQIGNMVVSKVKPNEMHLIKEAIEKFSDTK